MWHEHPDEFQGTHAHYMGRGQVVEHSHEGPVVVVGDKRYKTLVPLGAQSVDLEVQALRHEMGTRIIPT